MMKTNRFVTLFLVLALLCGLIISAAQADVTTLGIYLCGKKTAEDGTEITVPLEGRFRVSQNGEEVGLIDAGKNTLTLNGTERIRIAPLPESISPEWDLSNAYCEVRPEAGGTLIAPVILYPLTAEAAAATPAPAETPEPPAEVPEEDEETLTGETADNEEEEETEEEPVEVSSGPVVTPTLPPYDLSALAATPEPEWNSLPAGDGNIFVYAYYDQNNTGLAEENEKPVADVTVCLLTEEEMAVTAAVTDADGMVQFRNLPEGRYRIKVILPQGWAFNRRGAEEEPYAGIFASSIEGEAVSEPVTVRSGETATPGISLTKCLHVSGLCWFETVNDGLLKDGETMLPGVKITLDGEKNGLHYETISDEDGSWMIDRVNPAAYKLTAYAPDGMMFAKATKTGGKRSVLTRDGVGVASRRLDLNDKESKEKQYIGFTWAGQVKGRCFLDANYNGLYDEGEEPMAGVKLTAIKQLKDEEIAVTYSGQDGTFVLTGLRSNTYKIRAVLPDDGSDFSKTVTDPLGNHFKARPGRRENFWTDFVLADAEQREVNVGVIYPGSITGTVYLDKDFSASMDGNEKTVSGYLVTLLDENGQAVASDKTSIKGRFELTGLAPGSYSLSVTALKGYAFTKKGEGNVILNRTNGEGYSESFFLSLGENRTGMDIGMIQPGTVEGSVFADLNDNGIHDAGEQGLAGTVVRLIGGEGEAFSTEISEDGRYLFDAVMPGNYYLEYTLPENAVFARTVTGGNTIQGDKTGRSESFDMVSGQITEGPVCGALTLGCIDGLAYQDHNGDGLTAGDETMLEGMTITLTPSRAELETLSVTTGKDGTFRLEDLRPDTYTLTVEWPEAYVMSRTDHTELPLSAGKGKQTVSLPVSMGAVWTQQMLGAVIPAALNGRIWLDENNNGLFDDGEATPAGHEITVLDDETGKVFDTLRTDAEGRFETAGMIPGSFTLSYVLDENTIAPKDGDSQFREENGKLILSGIELKENELREGLLLGIVRYTSIGGHVWIDRGSAVEALSGAEIVLKNETGETLLVATTGADGAYRFDKLMPGVYLLDASMPEGCVIIEPDDPRLNADQISVMTDTAGRTGQSDPIILEMANDRLKMDIGCVLPGRMGDFCWLDLDGDGLQGFDEQGIPDVRIELQRNGETVMETVTDQYGFYRFNDLYPAVYTLKVTPPAEVKPTVRRTDIRLIASVLEETEAETCFSVEIQVESNKANYNADLGFVCRREGVLPAGVGEGKTQDWTTIAGSDK